MMGIFRSKGRLVTLTGKQLTIELDSDFRAQWDDLHDQDIDVTVSRHKEKRSLDANAYAWVLIDKIAEKKHLTKTEVYQHAIREIGGVSDIVCIQNKALNRFRKQWNKKGLGYQTEIMDSKIPGCTVVILYYGSSCYDTAQMSSLIDALVQDAQSIGIETRTPEQIRELLEKYGSVDGVV